MSADDRAKYGDTLFAVARFLERIPEMQDCFDLLCKKCEDLDYFPAKPGFSLRNLPNTYKDCCIYLPKQLAPAALRELTGKAEKKEKLSEMEVWMMNRRAGRIDKPPETLLLDFKWHKSFYGHRFPNIEGLGCPVFSIRHLGDIFVTAGDDGLLKLWDPNTGLLQFTIRGHSREISDLAIQPKAKLMASSSTDGEVKVWNFSTGKRVLDLHEQPVEVTCLDFFETQDKLYLVTCSKRGAAIVYDLNNPTAFTQLQYSDDSQAILAMSKHPDNTKFALACRKGIVLVCSVNPAQILLAWREKHLDLNVISWSPCGKNLVVGGEDSSIYLWKYNSSAISQYRQRGLLNGLTERIYESSDRIMCSCEAFAWAGSVLVSSSRSNPKGNNAKSATEYAIKVWSKNGCSILQESREVHQNRVFVIEVHPSLSHIILTCDYDGVIALWNLKTSSLITQFKESGALLIRPETSIPLLDCAFAPDGLSFVVSTYLGSISLYGIAGTLDTYATPVDQFLSTDYGPDDISEPYFCDSYCRPLDYQPPLSSMLLASRGIESYVSFDTYDRRYKQGVAHEDKVLALLKEVSDDSPEPQSEVSLTDTETSEESSESAEPIPEALGDEVELVVDTDPFCTRCRQLLSSSATGWCPECNLMFHLTCMEQREGLCIKCMKVHVQAEVVLSEGMKKKVMRDWLQQTRQVADVFIPQAGDVVVFLLQGFENYLKVYADDPLLDAQLLEVRAPTYMQIAEITYEWPFNLATNPSQSHILCRLLLEDGSKTYSALYRVACPSPDYLIPRELYDSRLVGLYSRINEGSVLLHRLQGIVHRVVVKALAPRDDKFPESPWESIIVDYLDLPEATRVRRSKRFHHNLPRVSFWELSWEETIYELAPLPILPREARLIERDIQRLKSIPQSRLFNEPVDTVEFSSYLTQIRVPMCILQIEQRLANGYYRSLKAVHSDIDLIRQNSIMFNGNNSSTTKEAAYVSKRLSAILELHLRVPAVDYPGIALPKPLMKPTPGYCFPHNVSHFPPTRYSSVELTEVEGRKKLRKLK